MILYWEDQRRLMRIPDVPENSTSFRVGVFVLSALIMSGFTAGCSGPSSPKAYTLTIIKIGTGDGTVSSSPSGLNCGEVCHASFKEGTIVTLTAAPNGNSSFETWSGDLTGTTNPQSLTMGRDKTITVAFTRIGYIITGRVTVGGAGLEGVTMAGLPGSPVTDASGYYSATVNYGTTVTVTPTHSAYSFDPASNTYTNVTSDITGQNYAATLITTSQRQALIAFYNATGGDNWTNNSGWKTAPLYPDGFAMPGTESGWHGLTVDSGTHTVTGIDFTSNNLVGTIPAGLGNLTSLTNLNLYGNPLTGSIPAEIGNLTALQSLYLDNCQLTGSIPATLGNLTALRELHLYNNQLTGSIPTVIGNLTNLYYIDLGNNHLTGSIPREIGSLTRLYKLCLNNNQLSGSIPAELGSLSNLGYLYLNTNELSGSIPVELCSLSNLRQLFLYSNELSGSIPPELGNMISLQWIVLRYNQLSGEIPAELGNLVNLLVLRLGDNQLSGEIPAELGNLVNLQSLRLADNQLRGEIPNTLGNLTQLWEMLINSNQLTGPIPTSLANLTALTTADFGYNALYTSDEALITFLNTKDPDWAAMQTIAPTQVTATSLDNAVILVSWLPIAYVADAGYYRVLISETPGGPYTLAGQTTNKTTTSAQVTGLTPGKRYYFVIQTVTNAHAKNQNIVESEYSTEATAVAWLQTQTPVVVPTITVTSPNGGETWALGSTHAVTWTQTGLTGTVMIDLYTGSVYQKTLGTADATAGTFDWTIDPAETAGTDYRVRVRQSGGASDDSDASFAITAAAFRKDDLLGTWDDQGVYYRDSDTGAWVSLAFPATMIASGDIDNDGTDDLIGLWPTQGGIWVKYSSSGEWAMLSSTAVFIATGDMNGDGRVDLLGSWDGQGVFYRDSATGGWVKMATPALMITSGDLDNDGTDDLIGIWAGQGGVWVKYSSTGDWEYIGSTPSYIAAGDMNGDGRDELLGSWEGQGVYYRNSETGAWAQMASDATMITAGDLDGDGTDDLIGLWPTQGGISIKYSSTGAWELHSSPAQYIAAGKMRPASGSSKLASVMALSLPMGGTELGPEVALRKTDESSTGPGGSRFVYLTQPNLVPSNKDSTRRTRVPGPGEPQFMPEKQADLFPVIKEKKRDAIRIKEKSNKKVE